MATEARKQAMPGLMMETPLQLRSIAQRAELLFGDREVVGVTATGVERSTWGAVLHPLNIRLFEDDLQYIVDHAEDRLVFLDASLAQVMPHFDRIETEILMADADDEREGAIAYEDLLSTGDEGYEFPEVEENQASAMCYTSGTTGRPKGVVYSHRSTMLHTLIINQGSQLGLRERDTVLPIVPMFHVNGWGLPYATAMSGSRIVLPGPRMDPASLARLAIDERVTFAAGIPTIWMGVAQLDPIPEFPDLERVMCGGSAVPESLIRTFRERFDVELLQGWGMTETSPVASSSHPPSDVTDPDQEYALRATQGRVLPLVESRIDEASGGELQVRGPTIARSYYRDESLGDRFTEDGWLRTGDVAEMLPREFIRLIDRTKDLVKSGGEWISSVELENAIMAHPDVLEAAVIAVPDARWSERPCACVVRRPQSTLDDDQLREFLSTRVAKWWLPERIEFITDVPKTSVGKFDKKVLRTQVADGTLHTEQ